MNTIKTIIWWILIYDSNGTQIKCGILCGKSGNKSVGLLQFDVDFYGEFHFVFNSITKRLEFYVAHQQYCA